MDISSVTERYYFDENGFVRAKATGLELTDEMKNGRLYNALKKTASICFVGDSLTEGTKNGDPFCNLPFIAKTALNDEYSEALEKYCDENNIDFINANPYIRNMLESYPDSRFLLDHIHPNSSEGVIMYSEAALSY